MRHSDQEAGAFERGRGTGKSPLLTLRGKLLKEEEEGSKKGKGAETPSRPVPRPQSDLANRDPRALKGKDTAIFDRTFVKPGERPWHELDRVQVRYRATTVPAVLLSKAERMAAGRDPGLEWDEGNRTYRPRSAATPAPRAATGSHAEGEGP